MPKRAEFEAYALTIRVQGDPILDATERQLSNVARALSEVLHLTTRTPCDMLAGHRVITRTDNVPRREIEWRILGVYASHDDADRAARLLLAVASTLGPITSSAQAHLYAIPAT